MNWKERAKLIPLFYAINSHLKCCQLKLGLFRLKSEYKTKAEARSLTYIPEQAINEFKRRHRLYQPSFTPRPCGSLRIFWVGTDKDQDESGFLQALNRVATVTVFRNIEGSYGIWNGKTTESGSATFEEIRQANADALHQQIVQAHASNGIDLLLGQMWAGLLPKEVLASVQRMGIPVINISMDDRLPGHWGCRGGVRLGSVGLASSVDMVLTTSRETCLWYKVEGCPALFWPLASDPILFNPLEDAMRDIDVLFIGNKYGTRSHIVRYLKNRGINVICYGSGWPNGHISADRVAELSMRARIILGIGTVGHCKDVYTLKLRDFDAPMSGAMYITHRNPDLCRLFSEGHEIECYLTPREATEKIKYYLERPEALSHISRNGCTKARMSHTWDQRLGSTFQDLGLLLDNPPTCIHQND